MSSAGTQKPPTSPTHLMLSLDWPLRGGSQDKEQTVDSRLCKQKVPPSTASTAEGWSLPRRSSQSTARTLETHPILPLSSKGQELDSHIQR